MAHLDQRNYRVQDEHFALVPKNNVARATFQRTHEFKFTGPSGYLIPVLVDEVLPGDVHTAQITAFARLSNLLFPLMDNARIDFQAFFVPNRIVWPNWKRLQGEQVNPNDSIAFTVPQVTVPNTQNTTCSLWDYFGIPGAGQVNTQVTVNALIPRGYNLIFTEWYRDQNLQSSLQQPTGDGPDDPAIYTLQRRNKIHDYFTSALPWPQKNNAVTLPLGGTAPVIGIGLQSASGPTINPANIAETGKYPTLTTYSAGYKTNTTYPIIQEDPIHAGFPNIYADLSQATGATINALRLAVQTQRLLETDARGGTRYTEILRARWGVTPQDARLQRPEYLGGGSINIQTAAIAQTSATSVTGSTTPLGGLAGQATAAGTAHFTCVGHEHGYIFVLASLMTKPTYQQGLHRMWTRKTRYDFAMPEFNALGEQAIRNDEIYVQGNGDSIDLGIFGYQERYAEYRFASNRVAGLFRSTVSGSYDAWHLAQKFTSLPTLGGTFIAEQAPFNRVLAAGSAADNAQFLCDMLFSIKSTRPIPAYGVPGGLQGTF